MLPFMNAKPKKAERKTVAFGGLNVTSGAREGELKNCKNVSAEFFPNLATRRGRTRLTSYNNASALYSFNGFVVVNGTDLIYNNQIVGGVSVGPKQFAVVDRKLVIHPDMLLLDLENNKLTSLSGEVVSESNSSTFGKDGEFDYLEVTASISGGSSSRLFTYDSTSIPTVKKYSSLSWSSEDGWTKTGEQEVLVTALVSGDKIIPTKVLESGAYVIPIKTVTGYTGEENNEGVFFSVDSKTNTPGNLIKWEKFNVVTYDNSRWEYSESQPTIADVGVEASSVNFAYNNYVINHTTGQFVFSGGANRLGSELGGWYIGGGTNKTWYFSNGSSGSVYYYKTYSSYITGPFWVSDYSYVKGSTSYGYVYGAEGTYPNNGKSGEFWYLRIGTTGENATTLINYSIVTSLNNTPYSSRFKVGDIVNISGCTTIPANNKNDLTVKTVTDLKITFEEGSALTAGTEAGEVKIERPVPALDFICGNDNRLWGVNSEGIYASAWADPTNFRKLSALSTDSYFVEIGSAGDFTGLFSYSGDVLCFKEDKMYRVFGNFPAEYSIQSYDIAGLQSGCEKSMAIINETLFYKGKEGVYALSGSTPQLISQPLELSKHFNAKAGADGAHYYISMQDDAGLWHLFVFDTITKLWIREDDSQAIEFAYQNGSLHMLSANNSLYKLNDVNSTEEVEWEAEFAVFFGDTLSRKTNNRLFLRVDLEAESLFEIEVKFDEGEFRRVFSDIFKGRKTMNIPVPIMRCDSFTLKLKGIGNCKIMAMEREFILGSEY